MRTLMLFIVFSLVCTLACAGESKPDPLPEASSSTIGYATVAEALNALKSIQGIEIKMVDGWTIATDNRTPLITLWSFAPESDPSYPSVVKRAVVEKDGAFVINMSVHCEATKLACDNLVRQFQQLINDQIRASSDIKSQKLSDSLYELTITLQKSSDITKAQELLMPEAKRVCENQSFEYGNYEYKAIDNIARSSSVSQSITLKQQVKCVSVAKVADAEIKSAWRPTNADNDQLTKLTEQYLVLKYIGKLAKAYDQLSDEMKQYTAFEKWREFDQLMKKKMGKIQSRNIQKVSWYNNPPGAPSGIYATVDYVVNYGNDALQCGYLGWKRSATGSFNIIREENNYIESESRKGMSPEVLTNTMAKFGCLGRG